MTLLQFMNNNMQLKEYENIKLYHGDCMDLMRETPDKYYDLCIVDPPYGINAGKMTMGSGKHKFSKDKDWDSAIPTADYFAELFRVSENQIVWGGNYFTEHLPPTPHWLLWDKKNPNLSFAEGELAWVRKGKNLRIFQHYSAMVEECGKIHPTQKPILLYDWIIKNYVNQGAKILDTHLGSGSIVISVDKANKINNMNLRFTGIEIDVDYFNDMIKRFENYKSQLTLNLQ
jgi:site-specific DNA-methyltransferase (adenine-specific)